MEDISVVMQKVIGALLVAISLVGCSTIELSKHKDQHTHCVFMVLDNGDAGDSCTWHEGNSKGVVNLIMIQPNLCHTLIHTVQTGSKYKSWEQQACYNNKSNKWLFYDR